MAAGSIPSMLDEGVSRAADRVFALTEVPDEPWDESLKDSLPLLLFGGVCLVIGLLTYPHASASTGFPPYIGLLLIIVGGIAAAGGVASLFARNVGEASDTELESSFLAARSPLTPWGGIVNPTEPDEGYLPTTEEFAAPITPRSVPASGLDALAPRATRPPPVVRREPTPIWLEESVPEEKVAPVSPPPASPARLSDVIASLEAITASVEARAGARAPDLTAPLECEQCGRGLQSDRQVPHCGSCGRILCPSCCDLHEGTGGEGLCMECALRYDPPNGSRTSPKGRR